LTSRGEKNVDGVGTFNKVRAGSTPRFQERRHVERLKAGAARAAAPEGQHARAPARDHAHRRDLLYLRLAMRAWHDRPPMRAGSTSMVRLPLGGTSRLFRAAEFLGPGWA